MCAKSVIVQQPILTNSNRLQFQLIATNYNYNYNQSHQFQELELVEIEIGESLILTYFLIVPFMSPPNLVKFRAHPASRKVRRQTRSSAMTFRSRILLLCSANVSIVSSEKTNITGNTPKTRRISKVPAGS
jgi:hypothetical protein